VNRVWVGLFLALCSLFPSVTAGEPRHSPAKVVVIPVRGEISQPQLYILRRGLKEAIEQKVDTIVLDMDTPGGALDVTFEMLKVLDKFPGKTVTYVHSEAISAGSLISAGTDEIYFAPDGVIGAAAPVLSSGQEIDATMRTKIVSYLKARVRSISEGKGYRGDVISAMIDSDSELKIDGQVLKPKGELLSLTAPEAMKTYGTPAHPLLGAGIAVNIDQLLDRLHGAGNYSVVTLEVSWSEKIAQYLTALTPVLMALGMMAFFIEFKTPGFGFFGITGMVLMSFVFFGHYIAGLSGHEPILFFLLGACLVIVEVFFFPGVFVLALTGIILMLTSLVWAMADFWPREPISISSDVLVRPLLNLLIGSGLAVLGFIALLKFLPKGNLWNGMVLNRAVTGEPVERNQISSSLIGQTGTAVTALFPSGQIEISGRRLEARLAVGHADAGTPVVVTGQSGFSVTVEVIS